MGNFLPYLLLIVVILLLGTSIWLRTKIARRRQRDEAERVRNRWYTFSE